MDFNINIGSALQPVEKLVSKSDTPRGLLRDLNIDFNNGNVTLDGRVLTSEELSQTLESLDVGNGSYLTVSTKQISGI